MGRFGFHTEFPMIGWLLNKIFGSQAERMLKKLWPIVDEINRHFEAFDSLSDEAIQSKTGEFRERLQNGEKLDDLLPEAFAVVKQACKRHVGKKWVAAENEVEWVEVPYDVQLFGGIVLHKGKISEMATGEGKTLVAVLPLYLNALEGRGCHLITTNDYLARRDSQWTGHILEWLGITVGCILQDMEPPVRREQYACDVTYGQNSEFGFDYLRDNMTPTSAHLVQGARSRTSQAIADEIIALATSNGESRIVADRFQTLIVETQPARTRELIEPFLTRFSLDSVKVLRRPEVPEAELPTLPERSVPVTQDEGDSQISEGMVWVHFQFIARDHHYAIIDEVDSILIDEARTPLIISGQVDRSTHQFDRMRPLVDKIVQLQSSSVRKLLDDGENLINSKNADERYQGGMRLFQAKKASPKNKRLMKLCSESDVQRLVNRCENDYLMDQKGKFGERAMGWVEEELFYSIDEKGHSVDLTEQGREALSPDNPDRFLLADLVEEFSVIEGDTSLTPDEREARKAKIREENEMKTEELHNITQLLRAFSLFEKDVDYVVQDNKVIIVDEFTGRLQAGRRYSDGLHQAIEAKECVKIEKETQTLASITIQNYFRMYDKLSGMTGTAETEAAEFAHTYKMEVIVIPSNVPIQRKDMDDMIYRTRREKFNAIIEEIVRLHKAQLPVLVGTVSVEVSELLSRMLKRTGVPHSVLNAKYHEKEAQIVKDAGLPGGVTIATNMAGRGVDIKLGMGVKEPRTDADGKEQMGGLQIIGTERHEARRIDRQLRGRAGRQGDPGTSRFFLSLEDDLMRLFGSDRISGIMQRLGLGDGEAIEHPFITRQIGRAQRRIEEINFEHRKRTLDYDNVMNKQRETIYGLRREVLIAEDLRTILSDLCFDALANHVETFKNTNRSDSGGNPYDLDAFEFYVKSMVPHIDLGGIERPMEPDDDYLGAIADRMDRVYEQRLELLGPELARELSRYIILHSIDDEWRDHLHAIDELRGGIHLRSYGQLDPLVEYQREATLMFQDLLGNVQRMVFEHFFRANVVSEQQTKTTHVDYGRGSEEPSPVAAAGAADDGADGNAGDGAMHPDELAKAHTFRRDQPKVGRNDLCPCGSGKKYKKCCGANE
jgi:preprotein translocase subunit SecA